MVKKRFSKNNIPLAQVLSQKIEEIKTRSISFEERLILRQHLLDAIASAYIGRRGRLFEDLINLCPKTSKGVGLPGCGKLRMQPLDASMLWAFAIHASVFEDGSREGACHPASAIIPSILVLSEEKDWDKIDRAILAGYEVMILIARSGNPQFTLRGFHPTAITAPFGCVAASSVMLDYDLSTIQNALCLSVMGSSGLITSFRAGKTQPLQVGWAVRNGLAAAMIAKKGHQGYIYIFEEGFFPAYLGNAPLIPIDKPMEYGNAVKGSYLKPYPGCRHLHPSIDALSKILNGNPIQPSDIEKIEVKTYRVALETEIHSLRSREDAYFNIPYAIASRIVLGKSDWEAFDEKNFSNPELLGLMKKVDVLIDKEFEELYPKQRGAIVEIVMKNGERFSERIYHALGEPENPLPQSFTLEKFYKASRDFISEKSIERIKTILDVLNPADSPDLLFKELYGEVE